MAAPSYLTMRYSILGKQIQGRLDARYVNTRERYKKQSEDLNWKV